MSELDERVAEVLAALDPKFRKRVVMGNEIQHPGFLKTPSYGLNRAMGGGFTYGRQSLIYGGKGSAKTSLIMQSIAGAQKEGKVCAWLDVEQTYDEDWARRLGVDTSNLIVSESRTINDMVDDGVQYMKGKVDVIAVDSISAALPAVYFEKNSDELKQLEDTKQIGATARDMQNAVQMLGYANNRGHATALLLISQVRNQFGTMHVSHIPTGGKAVMFHSATVVKLTSSDSLSTGAIMGKTYSGDKIIEAPVGRKVDWLLQNSKSSRPWQKGNYDFYFTGDEVGVDSIADLIDTAEILGIIERGGAWYTVEGERYQGRDNMVLGVKENLDVQEALIEKVANVKI